MTEREDIVQTETSLADIIKGRRQLIREDAPCDGCGTTEAECASSRGKYPTAPGWFGCCARGTALAPCVHRADRRALDALLREIESGAVRTAESIREERRAEAERKARDPQIAATDYYHQGEWWQQKDETWIRVADMTPRHRGNSARMILRHAAVVSARLKRAERFRLWVEMASPMGPSEISGIKHDIDERARERTQDPQKWMRSTALFKALADGLTGDDARGLAAADRGTGE